MPFKRMLVLLRGYPSRTPVSAIKAAVDIAVTFDAKISALSCAILQRVPKGILSGVIGVVPELVSQEREKAISSAKEELRTFSELARQRGVLGEALYRKCTPADVPAFLAGYARLSDLTIVPMPEGGYFDQFDSHWYLEAALFDSGRPVLVLPHGYPFLDTSGFGTVVVAWDHTRAAARAMADAMPILRLAKSVRVVTITHEKIIPREPPPLEVVSHLAAHGICVAYDAVDADGRDAATAIAAYIKKRSGDLLVMGGYGHSRLREFILGGATKDLLTHPPVPLFMSH
jgi:nucleotide-binding universal stress UspA family protein